MKKEDKITENFSAAASSGDCTGLIPSGADHTPDEIENYKDILPYSAPGAIKDFDKKELERIKKLNM